MEDLKHEGSAKTPVVEFSSNGELLLKGRSIPENSIEFYKPLIEWLESYSESPNSTTVLSVQLEYFNTSSSKCILDVFKKLESVSNFKYGSSSDIDIAFRVIVDHFYAANS